MQQIRNKMKKLVRSGLTKDEINVQLKAMFPETKESVIEKIVREKDNDPNVFKIGHSKAISETF